VGRREPPLEYKVDDVPRDRQSDDWRFPVRTPRLVPGRRKSDYNRTTITRKFVVIVAALIEFVYLVAQALLFGGQSGCF
jgi:hypothetical protein